MNSDHDTPHAKPSYSAYRNLLDAQRAALMSGNTRVLSDLSSRAGRLLDAVELPGSPPDDPQVREALAEALTAQASVRELTDRVRREQERLKLELSHARPDQLDRPRAQLDRRG